MFAWALSLCFVKSLSVSLLDLLPDDELECCFIGFGSSSIGNVPCSVGAAHSLGHFLDSAFGAQHEHQERPIATIVFEIAMYPIIIDKLACMIIHVYIYIIVYRGLPAGRFICGLRMIQKFWVHHSRCEIIVTQACWILISDTLSKNDVSQFVNMHMFITLPPSCNI